MSVLGFFSQYSFHALLPSLVQRLSAVVNAIKSVHFRFSFNNEVHLRDSFFSHKHITSLLPPLHTEVENDLGSGQAGSSGKQNKAIWFLRPYAAPTLNNRPGETTLSCSQAQPCSLLASVRRTHWSLTFSTVTLNLLSGGVFDAIPHGNTEEIILKVQLCTYIFPSVD